MFYGDIDPVLSHWKRFIDAGFKIGDRVRLEAEFTTEGKKVAISWTGTCVSRNNRPYVSYDNGKFLSWTSDLEKISG